LRRRIAREDLLAETHPFEIDAPDTARKAQAAQFVVIRADAREECMPLTVAGWDGAKSTATVVFVEAGRTTPKPAAPKARDPFAISSCLLGMPTLTGRPGTTVCAATEFAIVDIAPGARAPEQAHSRGVPPIGLRKRDLVFGEDSLRSAGNGLIGAADGPVSGIPGLNLCAITTDEVAAAIAAAWLCEQLEEACTR